ncbi:MAG: hypothetical protein P1P67_07690 [Treponema phagedenis]|uniref:hypothetical protein n=1 Tax=Treponema phagedenis TaxID=162 RepID=UPI000466FA8C
MRQSVKILATTHTHEEKKSYIFGRCGLKFFSYPTYFLLVGVEYLQTAGGTTDSAVAAALFALF